MPKDDNSKKTNKPVKSKPTAKPSKKSNLHSTTIAIVAIPLVVIILCVLAYFFFTKTWIFAPESDNKVMHRPTNEYDKTPLFTRENYPRIDGSTATIPLNLAFMENFTGQKIDPNSVTFNKTDPAYQNLIDGKTDLILVTSPSEDEQNRAKVAGIELEVTPVVNEGFVFFVNKDNPVDNLTSEQIKQIYEGKITNWKQIGGKDQPIAAFQRPANSGSQTGMTDLVMKDRRLMTPPTDKIVETMSQIIDIVSDYNNQPGAIGYSYYYYATTMYEDENATAANNIKLLKIDGVLPNVDSIKGGNYPFRTAYYIVINKAAPADSPARKLKDAMLSPRGQAVALEAKYVPVK